MKVGAIVLLIAVIGFFIFESVSLVMTIVKRKKEKKGATDKDTEYVIIKIGDYYNVCKIIDEFTPIEIDTTVAPFDKKQIYPIQTIKTEIRYLTYKEISEMPF